MLPLFTSHFSPGKSILTLGKKSTKGRPDSILSIAKKAGLKEVFVVEDDMSGFWEGYLNSVDMGLQFNFGLKCNFHNLAGDPESQTHKNIIFCKEEKGYFNLIKIHNRWKAENGSGLFYSDLDDLETEGLVFCVPFYDSFLHKNTLTLEKALPDLRYPHKIFWEDNGLPFDHILKEAVNKFSGGLNLIKTKSIYYKDKKDFETWQTLKCITNRGGRPPSLEAPNLEHCGSNRFCWEAYLEDLENAT